MGGVEQIDINAAIMTAGYTINTTFETEDINESLKIFNRFKREFKGRSEHAADSDLVKDIDLITSILTAAHMVNTRSHVESLTEALKILNEFRNGIIQIVNKVPKTFEERSELNIVAAIIVAGLVVNSIKWEEDMLESGVLLKACKEGLLSLNR